MFLLGILALAGRADAGNRLPPPLEARSCDANSAAGQRPSDRSARKGGLTTHLKVRLQGNALSVDDIGQGRDLALYDKLELVNPKPMAAAEINRDPIHVRARSFLWEHWRDQKNGYLILTLSSVDATSTSHVFVEPDNAGRWRVSWRIVRYRDAIDDLPTYYSVEWVVPAGWRKPGVPLAQGQEPDPVKDELEFRDKCGDVENQF